MISQANANGQTLQHISFIIKYTKFFIKKPLTRQFYGGNIIKLSPVKVIQPILRGKLKKAQIFFKIFKKVVDNISQ